MKIDRAALEAVDTTFFEKVWKLYVELNEREQHFNDLQTRYRTLASTWLLAAFAGIGFVLSETFKVSLPKWILVAGIGVAGALGIILIWILDVCVYHKLLRAGYSVGKDLEKMYSWLPPIRRKFEEMRRVPVRVYISFYYGAASVALLVVAVLAYYAGPVNQRSGSNFPLSRSSTLDPDKSRLSPGLGKEAEIAKKGTTDNTSMEQPPHQPTNPRDAAHFRSR